jgi:hypothetical protein
MGCARWAYQPCTWTYYNLRILSSTDTPTNVPQIFVFEDSVLLLSTVDGHENLSLWPIPPFQPTPAIPNVHHSHQRYFLLRSPNRSYLQCPQLAWFRSYPDHRWHMDLISMGNHPTGITRCTLKHVKRNDHSDLPPSIFHLSFQDLSGDYPRSYWVWPFGSTRLWDGSVLLLWAENHSLVANLSESPDIYWLYQLLNNKIDGLLTSQFRRSFMTQSVDLRRVG